MQMCIRDSYKAMQSSGMNVANYGTIFVTIADTDKDEALPLIRRFYDLGFNIEATRGTAEFLKANGLSLIHIWTGEYQHDMEQTVTHIAKEKHTPAKRIHSIRCV